MTNKRKSKNAGAASGSAVVKLIAPKAGENCTIMERVRIAIEEAILSGDLRPGERLDEAGLSARFGVSRTPVREALNQLAAAGLVVIRPHQGATVVKPTLADLIEMFEVMAELEAACAGLAARRHIAADRTAILTAFEGCEAAGAREDPDAFYAINNQFHEAIYRASHNRFLEAQTQALRNRLKPYRRQITFRPGRMTMSISQHREVMEAIFAVAPDKASQSMREHVGSLRADVATLIAALDSVAGPDASDRTSPWTSPRGAKAVRRPSAAERRANARRP
jgi:DNA-binding GntR family transcriptional regulator